MCDNGPCLTSIPKLKPKDRAHPLDAAALRLIAQGAPAMQFEELRKQGWRERSSR